MNSYAMVTQIGRVTMESVEPTGDDDVATLVGARSSGSETVQRFDLTVSPVGGR